MALIADEKNLPRIHLIGTLLIVLLLVLLLATAFFWQNDLAHRNALANIEQAVGGQIRSRLQDEMDNAIGVIDFTRSRTETELRQSLVAQVDAAADIAGAIHSRESGRLAQQEVRRLIVEALRPVRFFGGRGYYFIDDMSGRFVLMPTMPRLEGQRRLDSRDDQGQLIMRSLVEAAREPSGHGFARYRWYPPGESREMQDKLSYVRYFAPYDWFIGAGDYVHHWEARQRQEAIDRLRVTRFGQTGHVAVIDGDGGSLLSPAMPEVEGRLPDRMTAFSARTVEQFLGTARAGGGLVGYDWPDPVSGIVQRRTALVRTYEPWGWVLIATMFDDEIQSVLGDELDNYRQLAGQQVSRLLMSTAAAFGLAVAASLLFSRWSGRLLRDHQRRNVAQQATLRESEYRLNTILDSVEACIFIKASDHRYLYANRSTCEVFGRPLSQIVGHEDAEFFEPAMAEQVRQEDLRVLEDGERVAIEQVLHREGREITFSTVKLPLRDDSGRIYALCGVSTDISRRKQFELELAAARDAAQAGNRAKADFLANVSHELRTPLNAIKGMAHMLAGSKLSPRQQGWLDLQQQAVRRLLALIDDMLSCTLRDADEPETACSRFEPARLLDSVADRVREMATAKGLLLTTALAPDLPQWLCGDLVRIDRVLNKLADNAVKFTDSGSVRLAIGLVERMGDDLLLRFEVADTGPGLDEQERSRLFCTFEQVDASSTRRHGGAGLGLAIASRLVERMDGRIGVDSVKGQGSRFWFTLKLGCAQPTPEVAEPAAPGYVPGASEGAAVRAAPQSMPMASSFDDLSGHAVLQQLAELLGQDDVDSVRLLEENAALLRSGLGVRYDEVAQAVLRFDFPAALQALQSDG